MAVPNERTDMEIDLEVRGAVHTVAIDRVVNAGYSGRDRETVQEHIDELLADGVEAPDRVPATYRVPPTAVRVDPGTIEVVGEDTSGEAEFGLVVAGGTTYVVAASDQTDRALEREDVRKSKAIAPNVLSREAWRLPAVRDDWDDIVLRAWNTVDGERERYQETTLETILDPGSLLELVRDRYGAPLGGTLILSGTVPVLSGEIRPGSRFEVELVDPGRDRSLSVAYDVTPI
jgi:hypothetical protein